MDEHDDAEGGYQVGYGKPPLKSRFRKGRSGNPRGRPRRPTRLIELLNEALDAPTAASEPGQPRLSRRRAIAMRLAEQSVAGELRATKLIFELLRRNERVAGSPPAGILDEDDPRAFLAAEVAGLAAQLKRHDASAPDRPPTTTDGESS